MNPATDAVTTVTSNPAVGHTAAYAIAIAAALAIGFVLFFWRRHRARTFAQHVK